MTSSGANLKHMTACIVAVRSKRLTRSALAFALFSAGAAHVGCGGDVATGPSGGDGGAGGAGGGTGTTTTTTTTTSTTTTSPVGCPVDEPSGGQTCTIADLRCTYGDSVRPDCRNDWTCVGGAWTTTKSACFEPEPGHCPGSLPATGAECTYDGDVCVFGSTICQCSTCLGLCSPPPPHWTCAPPPATEGCPEIVPNDGTACSVPGLACVYGNLCGISGAQVECDGGAWRWQTEIACPA